MMFDTGKEECLFLFPACLCISCLQKPSAPCLYTRAFCSHRSGVALRSLNFCQLCRLLLCPVRAGKPGSRSTPQPMRANSGMFGILGFQSQTIYSLKALVSFSTMIHVLTTSSDCENDIRKYVNTFQHMWASQVALEVKNPRANIGDSRDTGSIPGQEDPLE